MSAVRTQRLPRFDRMLLPSMNEYFRGIGVDVRGRGPERRCDCQIIPHSSKQTFCFNEVRGVGTCHVCGFGGDVLALHQAISGLEFMDAARDLNAVRDDHQAEPTVRATPRQPALTPDPAHEQERSKKSQRAVDVWCSALPLLGSVGETYLLGRGCRIPPADGDLRFLADLRMLGFAGPCLVGRISKAEDAMQGTGVHLTWLHLVEGRWTRLERRYLGSKSGGVVRLWPDEAVTTGLAVAEGIETALAAAHAYAPVWACMDAGNLANFPVLEGIESLTIFADRDQSGTGQGAAAECADRWLDAGREVRIFASATIGHDIADEVAA